MNLSISLLYHFLFPCGKHTSRETRGSKHGEIGDVPQGSLCNILGSAALNTVEPRELIQGDTYLLCCCKRVSEFNAEARRFMGEHLWLAITTVTLLDKIRVTGSHAPGNKLIAEEAAKHRPSQAHQS